MAQHNCLTCGEIDPEKFKGRMKSMCYACHQKKYKEYYRRDRSAEPVLCRECGEEDPANFFPNSKSLCKKCSGVLQRVPYTCKHCGIMGKEHFDQLLKFTCLKCSKNAKPRDKKKRIPFICRDCGKTGREHFYTSARSLGRQVRYRCKECHNKKVTLYYYPFYNQLVQAQGAEFCCICKRTPRQVNSWRLVVDHDHKTGLVRGLLCSSCNWRLNQRNYAFNEQITRYLVNPPALGLHILFPEKMKKYSSSAEK